MLGRRLLSLLSVSFVLTLGGVAFSSHHPVDGPVRVMDFDESVNIVLGMPHGAAPVTSFVLERDTAFVPADLHLFPPNPCNGISQVWNATIAARMNREDRREFMRVVLGVLAQNECSARIVRDGNTNPPTIDSIQPIPTSD